MRGGRLAANCLHFPQGSHGPDTVRRPGGANEDAVCGKVPVRAGRKRDKAGSSVARTDAVCVCGGGYEADAGTEALSTPSEARDKRYRGKRHQSPEDGAEGTELDRGTAQAARGRRTSEHAGWHEAAGHRSSLGSTRPPDVRAHQALRPTPHSPVWARPCALASGLFSAPSCEAPSLACPVAL